MRRDVAMRATAVAGGVTDDADEEMRGLRRWRA
jgi:hypothetical protein